MNITLGDIAGKADYSVTTVSRTLNDYNDVSEEWCVSQHSTDLQQNQPTPEAD